jgi:hypothetical protein
MNFNTITVEEPLKVIGLGVNRLEKGSEKEIQGSECEKLLGNTHVVINFSMWLQNLDTDTKKVAQTETIWAILVNSSTPIENKVTQKISVMSREI